MANQLCFSRKTIEQAFEEDNVRGTDLMKALPNIGSYFQTKLTQANMRTINQCLRRLSQFRSANELMKFLTQTMTNERYNQCVQTNVSHPSNKYHAADVNVCAYNTMIKLVQFANAHVSNYTTFGFSRAFPCSFASQLRLRTRGSNPGSRHCTCHATSQECQLYPNDCRWNNTKRVCIPRGGGDEQAGFFGKLLPNDEYLAQRKRGIDGPFMGKTYAEGWMVQTQPTQPTRRRQNNPNNPVPPIRRSSRIQQQQRQQQNQTNRRTGSGNVRRTQRTRRTRRPNSKYPARDYDLNGGQLARAVHEYESEIDKRSEELRRFFNFVQLTKGF